MASSERIRKSKSEVNPAFLLIGGFLGSGKTTTLRKMVNWAADQGLRVGVIVNDQSAGLVDSLSARQTLAQTVKEVTGGCFCCRADSLVEAVKLIQAGKKGGGRLAPVHLIIAEPVGSCTDLLATVIRPLQDIYKLPMRMLPLTVVVDAIRCGDEFLGKGSTMAKGAKFLWGNQLQEAEVILVNKIDLVPAKERDALLSRLSAGFPRAKIFPISARTGDGTSNAFSDLLGGQTSPSAPLLNLDYQEYGAAEAELGWFNGSWILAGPKSGLWDPDVLALRISEEIQKRLCERGASLAHLKVSVNSPEWPQTQALVQAIDSVRPAETSNRVGEKIRKGELLVNLRAEADPDFLKSIVQTAVNLAKPDLSTLKVSRLDAFRPAQPTPTHRIGERRTA